MLTWALADRLRGTLVTVNALNPGYVATDLTRQVGGLLKAVVVLTSFRAQTPLDGADTAIWLAASPDVDRDHRHVLEQATRNPVPVPRHRRDTATLDSGRATDRRDRSGWAVTAPEPGVRKRQQGGGIDRGA